MTDPTTQAWQELPPLKPARYLGDVYGYTAEDVREAQLGVLAQRDAAAVPVGVLTDDAIAEWADGFIREKAFNRSAAVQIATEAAKWVRSQLLAEQIGWQYENLSSGRVGLVGLVEKEELDEWRKAEYAIWPLFVFKAAFHPGPSDTHPSPQGDKT